MLCTDYENACRKLSIQESTPEANECSEKERDFRSAIKSCFLFGSHQAHELHILLKCKLDFSGYRIITQVNSILSGTIMDYFISRERVRTIKLRRRHLERLKLDQSL